MVRWMTILQVTLMMVVLDSSSPSRVIQNSGDIYKNRHKAIKTVEERQQRKIDLEDEELEVEPEDRYIGYCDSKNIKMWPGNNRKFWSYGYVYLKEPYLAGCNMLYHYITRPYPNDPFCKFGFRVIGSFEGHTDTYTVCTDTDYVYLNDDTGNGQYYCGTNATIDWATTDDHFDFHFVTKADSPRAKGFFVIVYSFKLCGGSYNIFDHGPSGTLMTPFYPDPYPPNMNCSWYFEVPTQQGYEISVKVKCYAFELEDPFTNSTGDFCLDATTFTYEAPYTTENRTYCSNTLNDQRHVIYSTHDSLLMTFSSDATVQKSGFNCSYEFILFGE